MLSILTCQLSSIGSKTLGQGSRNLLSAAIGVRPQFRVSLRRVYELVTPVLKYPAVHRQKAWLHFSPPTLVERYHQLLPHEISCMGLLVHFAFLYRTPPPPPPKFPKPWLVFDDEPKLLGHMSVNRFQSLSAPLSISDAAVYMSSLPGYYKLQGWGCAD